MVETSSNADTFGQVGAQNLRSHLAQTVWSNGSILVAAFLVSLAIPIIFEVGTLRLSPYRIFLLVMIVPLLFGWIAGRTGKRIATDYLLIAFVVWSAFALVIHHGLIDSIEPAGILMIETLGPYLLARRFIRGELDFQKFVKILFWMTAFLFPFALIESLTGNPVLLNLLGSVFEVPAEANMEPRLGLFRAQVLFEHPILFGVFCSTTFGLAFYVLSPGRPIFPRATKASLSFFLVFLSLSTGALLSVIIQAFLIVWDYATRRIPARWRLLGLGAIFAYGFVDLISNRTPFHVFVTYLTFNVGNSYNRILIWHFGTAEVQRHPIFGIGMNEWLRPIWMSASMDNFWLVLAVRYGLPALSFMALAIIVLMVRLGTEKGLNEGENNFRKGILIVLTALMFSVATVHLWNATYCLFIFLLGSGVWLLDDLRHQ